MKTANDNDKVLGEMSPYGAALFSCFRHNDSAKQLEAVNNLNSILAKKLGYGVPTDGEAA